MKTNISVTWTLAELHDVYTHNSGLLTRKQMSVHLTEYFGDEIVVDWTAFKPQFQRGRIAIPGPLDCNSW